MWPAELSWELGTVLEGIYTWLRRIVLELVIMSMVCSVCLLSFTLTRTGNCLAKTPVIKYNVCVYVCAHAYMCISIIPNIWNHGRLHQQVTVNSVSDCSVLEPHCGNDRKFLRSVGKSVMSMCMRVREYYKCISFIDCSEFTHFIFQSLLHSTFCSI